MAHLVIVDTNRLGLRLLTIAKDEGHTVSFFRTKKNIHYKETVETRTVVAAVDRVITLTDTADRDELEKALTMLHAQHPVAAVISVFEHTIESATFAAAALGIPATSAPAVSLARSKYRMRTALSEAGIPCGRTIRVEGLDAVPAAMEKIGYPVMVKPERSTSSIMSQAVIGPNDKEMALELLRNEWDTLSTDIKEWVPDVFVCETYFYGPLISVEVVASSDAISALMVNERILPEHDPTIEMGTIMPSTLSSDEQAACAAYAIEAVRVAGLDRGIFHVELILTTEGPRFVEINPRLMGGSMPYLYDFLMGQHIYGMLIDVHLEQGVMVQPSPKGKHIFSLRMQVLKGGTINRIPVLNDLPLEGLQVHMYEMPTQVGDIVEDEDVLGRFYIETDNGDTLRNRADSLLLCCQEIFGVELMLQTYPTCATPNSGI
ncbi:MAG: ATP-grasp domain-containing protein [Rhodobacteraceae bacterium]|nr:ATP-grasp domain-containing protein [Paracoccaceae bacterium]